MLRVRFLGLCLSGFVFTLGAAAQTLGDALRQAELNNPQLEAQRQARAIAGERVSEARSERRPEISVSGSYGYQSVDTNRPQFPGVEFITEQPVANAELEAVLPLYTGGQISAGIRQARAGESAADAQLEAVRQDLNLQVLTAYLDVLTDRRRIEIRENSVALLEAQAVAAADRFEVGVVTRTDVALSEARREGGRAALAGAQAALEASEATYTFLVGMDAGSLAPPPPTPSVPETIEAAVDAALRDNPNLEALIFAVRSADEAIDVSAGSLKPSVAIVGTASVQETFTDNFRDESVTALLTATVPLFERGVVKSQVRQARLERDQARFELENARRQIRASIAQAWYGRIAAEQSIAASDRQVAAAEIAYEGALEELEVGTRTTLDVLDQEQDLLEARLSLVEAERDFYVATGQLLNAMGQLNAGRLVP